MWAWVGRASERLFGPGPSAGRYFCVTGVWLAILLAGVVVAPALPSPVRETLVAVLMCLGIAFVPVQFHALRSLDSTRRR
ncbi:hypothetical protein GCM10009725_16670 [Aeromicrobium tamlense]|uniref:Uncharacterized protein n=1 Tax=Aeromicrobium tamlense TaxID=375541 RepID=A0ABX2SLJ6_9ACTN|nr:hypothetical protein [Aeromicrobium sp. HA]NYI39779.1 hypothetical protein [Aeromicrobium tamlense]